MENDSNPFCLRINQRDTTYHLKSFITLKKPKLQYCRNHRQILANQIIFHYFELSITCKIRISIG